MQRARILVSRMRHQPLPKMLAIEKLIFPPQKFTSWGIVFRSRLCSICGSEYGEGDCDHLVGKPYMGEICHTRVLELETGRSPRLRHPSR